jgi:hypothetical protein
MPASGFVQIIGDAEFATFMFELAPQDCGSVAVVQDVVIGPCIEGTITITGAPGSNFWFWVGSTTFDGPVNEYDYMLYAGYLEPAIATEAHSWSSLKQLFD